MTCIERFRRETEWSLHKVHATKFIIIRYTQTFIIKVDIFYQKIIWSIKNIVLLLRVLNIDEHTNTLTNNKSSPIKYLIFVIFFFSCHETPVWLKSRISWYMHTYLRRALWVIVELAGFVEFKDKYINTLKSTYWFPILLEIYFVLGLFVKVVLFNETWQ